jgi:hypothetical protein
LLRPNALLGIPFNEVFEFQLTAVIVLDQIWFARNQLIQNNMVLVISNTLKTNANVVRTHLTAWKSSPFGLSIWQPPPPGSLKINFDVAVKNSFSVLAAVVIFLWISLRNCTPLM